VRLKLVLRLNFASRGWGSYKGLKSPFPLSSILINDHMHAANSSKPCPSWERREKRKGERNMDFNTLLIHFSSRFQTRGRLKLFSLTNLSHETKGDPNMPYILLRPDPKELASVRTKFQGVHSDMLVNGRRTAREPARPACEIQPHEHLQQPEFRKWASQFCLPSPVGFRRLACQARDDLLSLHTCKHPVRSPLLFRTAAAAAARRNEAPPPEPYLEHQEPAALPSTAKNHTFHPRLLHGRRRDELSNLHEGGGRSVQESGGGRSGPRSGGRRSSRLALLRVLLLPSQRQIEGSIQSSALSRSRSAAPISAPRRHAGRRPTRRCSRPRARAPTGTPSTTQPPHSPAAVKIDISVSVDSIRFALHASLFPSIRFDSLSK
jgi:hypothetical protein